MNYSIQLLSETHLPMVDAFSCVETAEDLANVRAKEKRRIRKHSQEMQDYLKKEALQEQNNALSATHLFIDEDNNRIMAYVSLCNDAIRLEFEEQTEYELRYTTVPAMKIARLAVANEYKHQGLGSSLIQFSAYIAQRVRRFSGIVFLTLDCYAHRETFYKGIGFVRNLNQPNQLPFDSPISMRIHLDTYMEQMDET